MIRGFRQIAYISLLSRLLGMARDMGLAYIWGRTGLTDLWVIALTIPNTATRLLGEGTLASSVIPAYLQALRTDRTSAARLAGTILSVLAATLCLVAAAIGAICILWPRPAGADPQAPVLVNAITFMLPYMVLAGISIATGAILNAHDHFAAPATSPAILNICILAAIWVVVALPVSAPRAQLMTLAAAVVWAGVMQVLVQVCVLYRLQIPIRPCWAVNSEAFRMVLRSSIPVAVGLTVTQTNTLINNLLAYLATAPADGRHWFDLGVWLVQYPLDAGATAGLYYAQRLYQFPLGVLGISLATAAMPSLGRHASTGRMDTLTSDLVKAVHTAIFVAFPATALLMICGKQAIEVLFERGSFTAADTQQVLHALWPYGMGLTAYFLQQILARALYAMPSKALYVPLSTGIVALAANLLCSMALLWPLGTAGLAISTAVAAYVQVGLQARAITRLLGKGMWQTTGPVLAKTVLCTALMSIATIGILKVMGPSSGPWRLVTALLAGGISYTASAWMLGLDQTRILGLSPRRSSGS